MKIFSISKWIAPLIFCLPIIVKGQPDSFKCRKEPFSLNSGIHDGIKRAGNPIPAFHGTVQISDAPWLKIYFGNCELGQNSYIKMTSLEDGGYQNLNTISLKQWSNTSAFFNGNAVEVELYVDPEDRGVFVEVKGVVLGERFGSLGKNGGDPHLAGDPCSGQCGICGSTDDRVPYNDPAILRMSRINALGDTFTVCTGWIASNGTHIAAGHCWRTDTNDPRFLEFNVPASDSDGAPNFAHPNDQYPIDFASLLREDLLWGRDWALFKCFPNSNTGLLPVQAQNAFYRLSLDSTPETFRITGYGVDECPVGSNPPPPLGTGNGRNSSSNTLQTHTGPNNGPNYEDIKDNENFVYWTYCIDHRFGNSGGPLIPEGTNLSVGIISHCVPIASTSFDCDALENAVNNYPGSNIRYADNGHPYATGSGTVFRPYNTIAGAVTAVSAGGIVSIVKGSYNESMTINKAMTITAPVGNVTIGPGGPPKVAEHDLDPKEKNSDSGSRPMAYRLSQNYPNPFNPETTIEFTLPKPGFVKLTIYDMLGQEVRTLVNEFQQAGTQSVIWEGKNNNGQLVPSGVYIYSIAADGFTQSSKSVLLK